MSSTGHFAEILQEKMGAPKKGLTQKSPIQTGFSLENSPFFEVNFNKNFTSFNPVKKVYPTPSRPSRESQQVKTPIKKAPQTHPQISILRLSENSQKSYFLLLKLGAQFEDGKIDSQALKNEYRRLAKVFHPDSPSNNSCSKKFHYLHTCYKVLTKALDSHETTL